MAWCKLWVRWSGLTLLALACLGCGSIISENIRRQADRTIAFGDLRANPDVFKDRLLLLGGAIVQTHNTPEGSLLEVLHKPLDSYDRPSQSDYSEGRFMARCEQYLDPAIYTAGREVTVAGRVLGARAGQIGEMAYTYPFLSCVELHLWPKVTSVAPRYGSYPWWYWEPWYWDYWHWQRYPYPRLYLPY